MVHPKGTHFGGEILFLVEGTLDKLHTSRVRVHLLADIERRLELQNQDTDVAASLNAMYDTLTSAAGESLLTDDDDTYNFAALLDDRIVCGSFTLADKLSDGDYLKAVVSERRGVLWVHSLTRANDRLMLLPVSVYLGQRAFLRSCLRTFWISVICLWSIPLGIYLFDSAISAMPAEKLIIGGSICFLGPLIMVGWVERSTYRMMENFASYASAIFTAFGFPRPNDLNALKGMSTFAGPNGGFSAINIDLALNKHSMSFKKS